MANEGTKDMPIVLSAKTLIGDKVINLAGKDLGRIEDIMLHVDTAHIAYAVLSFGGVLGIGNKFFAVPWGALRLDARHKKFILDVDEAELRQAPGFDKDNWPNFEDHEFGMAMYAYYKFTPSFDQDFLKAERLDSKAG